MINLKQKNIEERLFTCRESEINPELLRLIENADSLVVYRQEHRTSDVLVEILKSQQISELNDYMKKSFAWTKGKYTITIKVTCCESVNTIGASYCFSLSKIHVSSLEKNKELIFESLGQQVSGLSGDTINWETVILNLNPSNETLNHN